MKLVKTIDEVRECVEKWRQAGYSVGLVPTMGYLHEGHASLIRRASSENDKVVVSIFVNPMQFGPNEDLDCYPRDLERDQEVCKTCGAALIFNPSPEELYPSGFCTFVDMTGPTDRLCGSSRPTHFRGVCTVVNKLLNVTQPDRAYFGQKDAQQLAVIRRMTADLNIPVSIVGCPIVREPDGLALSSRNKYLNPGERKAALCLSNGLNSGQKLLEKGERDPAVVQAEIHSIISQEPLARIDYVELVDSATIQPVAVIDHAILCAVAVYIGKTRLIDNFIWENI
ncbi:MAG: pantoate--beta-alanine ligase [Lachnospiraceae bacterium]